MGGPAWAALSLPNMIIVIVNATFSHAIILDHRKSWINVMRKCLEKYETNVFQVWEF